MSHSILENGRVLSAPSLHRESTDSLISVQVNKKFRKFERKYRDCIKRNGDKIGTQTCYDVST